MDEEKKKQIATFRFGVIHDLTGGMELQAGEQERLLQEKSVRKWIIPFSDKTRITRSTLLRWIKLYRDSNGNLAALYPQERSDRGQSRSLDEETGLALLRLRKEMPRAIVRKLMREMHKRKLVTPGVRLNFSTCYRFLHCQGAMKAAGSHPPDRRKFEAELPNDLWQSDCLHGPTVEHNGKHKKTYLIAFIDDHSRLIPYAGFYLSETTQSFLHTLEQALLCRGLPRKIYTDNGSAFRSHHLEHVAARLGIALIHARPYQPQGKGKIERFFRHVRGDFLSGWQGKTLEELNAAWYLWLQEVYHQRQHSSTGQTPFARFTARLECLRPAPQDLKDHFRKPARRKVAKDRTISLQGKIFEAPVALIDKQVALLYHEDNLERVEVFWNDLSYGFLHPVDIHVNCRVKRDKNNDIEIQGTGDPQNYRSGRLWPREEKP